VAFLLAIIRRVADAHDGDPKRAFVMGISNGGMMVQRLACEAGGAFKAYAAVAANLPAALARGARPSQPVPIVLFSGTADQLMPFAGGELGKGRAGRGAGGHVISAPDTVRFWAELNGCRNESVVALPDKENDGTQVLLHSFEGCRPGGEVEFYEIVGGGHTWPGGTAPKHPALRRLLGNVSADIDATAIALDFFRRHGL
jgi:polyhydroxybutyrate depolymerase